VFPVADPSISLRNPHRIGSGRCWFCDLPDTVRPADRGRIPELCLAPSCRTGWADMHRYPNPATHRVTATTWAPIEPVPVPPPPAPEPELATLPATPTRPTPKPGSWKPWAWRRR
jgi:hypothetical protein